MRVVVQGTMDSAKCMAAGFEGDERQQGKATTSKADLASERKTNRTAPPPARDSF